MRDEWKRGKPPNEEELYLLQFKSGRMEVCQWTEDKISSYSSEWNWVPRIPSNDPVVAWHLLPAPYVIKEGNWKYDRDAGHYECSKCGKEALYEVNEETGEKVAKITDYCPYCGTFMWGWEE